MYTMLRSRPRLFFLLVSLMGLFACSTPRSSTEVAVGVRLTLPFPPANLMTTARPLKPLIWLQVSPPTMQSPVQTPNN